MATTFGSATITLKRGSDGDPQWLEQPLVDERNLLGVHETDVNVMGWGSAELQVEVLCQTQADYWALRVMNGMTSSLTVNDGEGARNCMLTIQSATRRANGMYLCTCRFKVVD